MNQAQYNWIETPASDNSRALEEMLSRKSKLRLDKKEYLAEEVLYIADKKLLGIATPLQISKERLEKLRALCQLWEIQLIPSEITSHRRLVGPLIVGFKRILFPILRFILKDMIRQQKSFNATCVALLIDLANEKNQHEIEKIR